MAEDTEIKKLSLMDIVEVDQTVKALIESTNDEETKALLESAILSNSKQMADKIDAIAYALDAMEAKASFLRERGNSLLARARTLENEYERLKGYVLYVMSSHNKSRLEGGERVLSLRWNPAKAVPVDPTQIYIPKEFERVKIEADRYAIKQALEAGQLVEGWTLVKEQRLEVK